MRKKTLSVLFLLFMSVASFCQKNIVEYAIDSLQHSLLKLKEDTNKVNTLNNLADKLISLKKLDSAFVIVNQSMELASKLSFRTGIARSYINIGNLYKKQTKYGEALNCHLEALKIWKEINSKGDVAESYNAIGGISMDRGDFNEALKSFINSQALFAEIGNRNKSAGMLNNIGVVYKEMGNYTEAIKNYMASLVIKEEFSDKKSVANILTNVGNIYREQGNFPESLKNYLLALKMREEMGDKNGVAIAYNNMGLLYSSQGNFKDALENHFHALKISEELNDKITASRSIGNIGTVYLSMGNNEEALKYHLRTLSLMEEIHDKKGIANALKNLGVVYAKNGKIDEAEEKYRASLKLRIEMGDKQGIASCLNILGVLKIESMKYSEARTYLDSSLVIFLQIGNKEFIQDCYRHLSTVDSAEGRFLDAFQHYKRYTIFKDSMLNETSNKLIIQMKTEYETEKKDKEISLLNKDKEIQNLSFRQQKTELDKTHLLNEKQNQDIAFKNLALEKNALTLNRKEQEKQLQKLLLQRKESQIIEQRELSNAAMEKQSFIRNSIIGGAVFLAMISLLLFNRYQLRKKIESQQAIIDERVRISRELHDDVGAQLSTAKIFLHDLKKNLDSEKGQEMLDNSLGILDTSIKDLRVVMDDLRQSTLKDKGYLAATEELVKTVNRRHGIKFELSHHGLNERLPQQNEHHLFRITQELINNTLKYAKANRVNIDLVRHQTKLVLTYEDNGIGFEPGKIRKGYGLSNMESRIQSLDGHIELHTSPGKGFMAILEIPVKT